MTLGLVMFEYHDLQMISPVKFSQSRTRSRLEDDASTAVGQSVVLVQREIVFACLVDKISLAIAFRKFYFDFI